MPSHANVPSAAEGPSAVGALIGAVLPYAAPAELALRIVTFWGRTGPFERCRLELLDAEHWSCDGASWDAATGASLAQGANPPTQDDAIRDLVVDGHLIGRLVFPRAAASLPQVDELVDATARILATALTEERRLSDRKLAALAEYAAGAGHEINNPLGSIIGRVAQLLEGESDPERRRALRQIGGQAYRIRDMIGDTMLFARPPAVRPEWGRMASVLDEVVNGLRDDIADKRLSIECRIDPLLEVWADPTQLRVVFAELLRNAMAASPVGSTIVVSASGEPSGRQGDLHWSVENPGSPLSATEMEHAFDPFFSGRQAGRGLGFGLSKCRRVVTLHGGEISLTHRNGTTRVAGRFPGP